MTTRTAWIRSRTAKLTVLTFAHILVDMYGGFLLPLLPAIEKRLGVEAWVLATFAGFCGIVVNGVQPLAGMVSPRLRRPTLMLVAPVLAGAMALMGVWDTFWGFAIVVLVGFVGVGVFHPDALVSAQVASGRRDHLGVPIFLSGGFLGISAASLLSTQWVTRWGFSCFWVLAVPGVLMIGLYALAGLHHRDGDVRRHVPPTGATAPNAPNLWMLMLLGVLMASPVMILFTFLNFHQEAQFGDPGLRWGGYALAMLGFSSMLGSYLWGYLSVRVSPFTLIAVGQFLCVPIYLLLVGSHGTTLVLLSIPVGLTMGGAFFPVVTTLSRRSRALTPALRAGLIIGGTWGVGCVVQMVCGLVRKSGVASGQILQAAAAIIAVTGVVALVMRIAEGGRDAETGAGPRDAARAPRWR